MAVEMMMIMKMIVSAMMMTVHKHTGWKNQHGDKIHIYVHYACMKQKMICISTLDWRTWRTGEKQQNIKISVAKIVDSFMQTPAKLKTHHSNVEQASDERHAECNLQNQ